MIVSANSDLGDVPPVQVESWARLKKAQYCGVDKWLSRQLHTLEIVGSNPTLPQPYMSGGTDDKRIAISAERQYTRGPKKALAKAVQVQTLSHIKYGGVMEWQTSQT